MIINEFEHEHLWHIFGPFQLFNIIWIPVNITQFWSVFWPIVGWSSNNGVFVHATMLSNLKLQKWKKIFTSSGNFFNTTSKVHFESWESSFYPSPTRHVHILQHCTLAWQSMIVMGRGQSASSGNIFETTSKVHFQSWEETCTWQSMNVGEGAECTIAKLVSRLFL